MNFIYMYTCFPRILIFLSFSGTIEKPQSYETTSRLYLEYSSSVCSRAGRRNKRTKLHLAPNAEQKR